MGCGDPDAQADRAAGRCPYAIPSTRARAGPTPSASASEAAGIASAVVWEGIVASGHVNPPIMTLLVVFLFAAPSIWGVLITVRATAAQSGLRSAEAASFAVAAGVLLVAIGFLSMLAKGVILGFAGSVVDALTG